MTLSRKQIKFLRGLAHSLDPVVMVGKEGITPAVIKEMDTTLKDHELIKIKVRCDEREEFLAKVADLEEKSRASLVQTIGRMAVFYRAAEPGAERKKKRKN